MGKKNRREGRRNRGDRVVSMSPEVADALARQRQRFIEKFGREPGPEDPVFFDPNAGRPIPMVDWDEVEKEFEIALEKTGADPAFAYAFKKTGRLVGEENRHLIKRRRIS